MLAQFKCIILVLLFVQASAFAKEGDKALPTAGANDVIAPVVMKTSNPDEVNVGAFSFAPNDNADPQAISKLRAELLKMEKDLFLAKEKLNNSGFIFVGLGNLTAKTLDLVEKENIEEVVKNQRLEILNLQRLESLKKQSYIYQTTQNKDEKIKAEIAIMELSLDLNFLRQVVEARKNGATLSDQSLLIYTETVKKLSPEAKSLYIKALSDKARKQFEKFNPRKYKLYIAGLEKIDNFKAIRQLEKQHELEEQARIKTNKEIFISTNKRFAPETFAFFVASGAVTFNMMWIKSQGDPLQMERHIMSLKDPIAHISFYAFMQANGFFTNFHTSKASFQALDASAKRQMMVKLSYAGMAVGSLASSIVSDIGQSIVTCSQKWIQGKKDEASLESCNQAMKQWTVRKKTNQYFPQIIALFASQAVTELVENSAYRAFERMAVKSFGEKYLTRKALQGLAYRISAADVVLTCIPYAGEAKWISKGLKFVGTVTKLSAFVAVDHILSSYVNRPISNILKPTFFDNKNVPNMNASWLAADSINWDDAQSGKISRAKTLDEKMSSNFITMPGPVGLTVVPFKMPPVSLKNSFPEDIESYTEEMQAWRSHLNESADADLAGWEEMTKKLLYQIDFSYQFYKKFTSDLFTTLNTKNQVDKGELDASAMSIISQYPLNRNLPFYGVNPGPLLKESAMKINDKYLSDPIEIEKLQKENILNLANKYSNLKLTFDGRHNENQIYAQILSKLSSGKVLTMMNGLVQLRKVYNDIGASHAAAHSSHSAMVPVGAYNGPHYDSEFETAIKNLFAEIGNPMPIMDPLASYSQAAAAHTIFKGMDELADYSQWSLRKKYQFNKVTDLMIYKILCGKQDGSLNQIKVAGALVLSPEFDPPSLLKENNDSNHFCKTMTNSSNLYYSKINNESTSSYMLKNFNFDVLGDFTQNQDPDAFDKWWITHAKKPMEKEFKKYDLMYKQVYQKAYDNFIGDGTWYENLVDNLNTSTEYLPNTIKNSFKTENSVYLQLINRALIEKEVKLRTANPKKGFKVGYLFKGIALSPSLTGLSMGQIKPLKTDYLAQSNSKIKDEKFDPIYNLYRPEVAKLFALLNNSLGFVESYHKAMPVFERPISDNTRYSIKKPLFVLESERKERGELAGVAEENEKANRANRFNQYIENSKQIDKAINDILVQAGLKKLVKKADAQLTEDQMAEKAFENMLATASGNESTEDVYEDLDVKNPTLRQKVIISAVKGIRQVESETRRFIRMNMLLSNRLYVENQEILSQIGSH